MIDRGVIKWCILLQLRTNRHSLMQPTKVPLLYRSVSAFEFWTVYFTRFYIEKNFLDQIQILQMNVVTTFLFVTKTMLISQSIPIDCEFSTYNQEHYITLTQIFRTKMQVLNNITCKMIWISLHIFKSFQIKAIYEYIYMN